jgi:hypothetical protein
MVRRYVRATALIDVMEVAVLHMLAFSQSAVTIRHWFEVDLDDASMEHGARIEIRRRPEQQHRGSESASQLITADQPLWRADLFDRIGDGAGTFAAAHYHPEFAGHEPCARAWDTQLTADPWGWLGDQLTNVGAGPGRGGWPLDPADADEVRTLAPEVVALARTFSPTECASAVECHRLTRDVDDIVRLMLATVRQPSLINTGWVAPWLQP